MAVLHSESPFAMALKSAIKTCKDTLRAPYRALDPILDIGPAPLDLMRKDPEAVIDLAHGMLHAYSFDAVPLCWRRCYEEAQLWAATRVEAEMEQVARSGNMDTEERLDVCLSTVVRRLDMALILTGAPARSALIHRMLEMLRSDERDEQRRQISDGKHLDDSFKHEHIERSTIRTNTWLPKTSSPADIPTHFLTSNSAAPPLHKPITRLNHPSLSAFQAHWHSNNTPAILTNTLAHWPALHRWRDPHYWMSVTLGGRRLMPVELGSSYTDEAWGQKIMTFGNFMRSHLLGNDTCRGDGGSEPDGGEVSKGYLAQHDLLTQIPALYSDIAIPDFCYVDPNTPSGSSSSFSSASSEATATTPAINIWLGPAHTVSPAHTDPHHNILAQVFGRKYVRLYAPDQSLRLYPMGGGADEESENGEDTGDVRAATGGEGGDARELADGSRKRKVDVTGDLPGQHGGEGPKKRKSNTSTKEDAAIPQATTTPTINMSNTSRLDVGLCIPFFSSPNNHHSTTTSTSTSRAAQGRQSKHDKQAHDYPLFVDAKYIECVLEPGECLFIPRGWWHYVRSLPGGSSCSVSFWWD